MPTRPTSPILTLKSGENTILFYLICFISRVAFLDTWSIRILLDATGLSCCQGNGDWDPLRIRNSHRFPGKSISFNLAKLVFISGSSTCQIEVDATWNDVVSHAPDGEWAEVAPLRILGFDIECAGRKGIFPEPDKDRVIQIANMVATYGKTEPFIRNVLTLDTCTPIIGSQVLCHDTEEKMLDVRFIYIMLWVRKSNSQRKVIWTRSCRRKSSNLI